MLALVLMGGLIAVLGLTSPAHAADSQGFVKWYAVQSSYQGQPENLPEIASRFLGAATRFTDIFNLNVGRQQPDGAALNDPDQLHPGWLLVLPWDAVGAGVMYGALPTIAPQNAGAPAPAPAKPRATTPGTPAARPPIAAVPSTRPTNPASGSGHCLTAAASSSQSDWAALRLAPDQAWSQSRGKGQMVAVVDSGVDGSLPQLAGHVAVGADIVNGSGRGDTDCLGTGTAMAGIIAAQPNQGGTTGIAPDATVLPVRVVTSSPSAQPSDEASAIQVAVSAGATVLALGSYVNVADSKVSQAIGSAVQHNVVVVCAAPTAADGAVAPSPDAGKGGPGGGCGVPPSSAAGTLSVGAVGVDGRLAANYQPGSVNVVAPGVNVPTLGITGTGIIASSGTQYAVAFVAGEVALVRAGHPNLTAAQVVHRVERTADSQSATAPDSTYGWGLINPAAAVSQVLDEEASSPRAGPGGAARSSSSAGRTFAIILVLLIGLAAGTLLTIRIRHAIRSGATDRDTAQEAGHDAGPGDDWNSGGRSHTDGRGLPHRPGDTDEARQFLNSGPL